MPPAARTVPDASNPAVEGAPDPAQETVAAPVGDGLEQKTLRFVRSYQSWNRGVEAGFAVPRADELIRAGYAVQIHPPIPRSAVAGMVRK